MTLDTLKLVERRTYIQAGQRRENSAEHSWHLAIACWSFARCFNKNVSLEKLLQMALIHDLGEIDAGDTFLYDPARANAVAAEEACVKRLAAHPGNAIDDMLQLWRDQEAGQLEEARLLKVVDRLLPFMHNMASDGKAWRENNIARSQVLAAHEFVKRYDPEIYRWVEGQAHQAVANGWLRAC